MEDSEWTWLPSELLTSILDKLFRISDYVRFSAVCKPWQSVAVDQKLGRLQSCHKHIPMLMIPTKYNSEEECSLYCVVEGKFYEKFRLRVPYNKRCVGSSFGWLANVGEDMAITLINPFFGDPIIRLPPVCKVPSFPVPPEFFIKKVILSSNPSVDDNYMVAVIFGVSSSLAFLRSGNKDWSYLEKIKTTDLRRFNATDAIYYKGQLLVVDARGETLSIGFNGNDGSCNYEVVVQAPAEIDDSYLRCAYLVEASRGDLLLVQKYFDFEDGDDYETGMVAFKVFKIVNDGQGQSRWVKIENLQDDILFVGNNYSTCISNLSFPGCQTNSIYYTRDRSDTMFLEHRGPHDISIFDLDDKCIYTHYKLDPSQKHMLPAIWIIPSFNLPSFG